MDDLITDKATPLKLRNMLLYLCRTLLCRFYLVILLLYVNEECWQDAKMPLYKLWIRKLA